MIIKIMIDRVPCVLSCHDPRRIMTKKTKTDKNGLSERQVRALPFLIASSSEVEGCQQANIARQTYYEWLKEPAFREELSRLRNIIVDNAVEKLKAHTSSAVDVLIRLLTVDNPSIQRNTANDVLGHVLKFKEQQEIEKRLEALESKVK